MTHELGTIVTERGLMMSLCVSALRQFNIPALKVDIHGIITASDRCICRDAYRVVRDHRSGIIVVCIDGLMIFNASAMHLIFLLARRAMLNTNILHLVVGNGAVRARTLQIGLDSVAHLHNSYDDFLTAQGA